MQALLQPEEAVCVVLLETAEEINLLLQLFEKIASEQGWRAGKELRTYGASAIYFGLQRGDRLIGGLELIVGGGAAGLPCQKVWPELSLKGREDVADIALLALDQEHRGQRRLFWLLCVEMWRFCQARGITELWAEVTPANLKLYQRLGWPLQIAGPLRFHWGEECYPCRMSVEEAALAIQEKATRSKIYQQILERAFR